MICKKKVNSDARAVQPGDFFEFLSMIGCCICAVIIGSLLGLGL